MTPLTGVASDRLIAAPFTYAPVGGTPDPQPGFQHLERRRRLIRSDFRGAADDLLAWRVHERSGLRVSASAKRAAPDVVVLMTLGIAGRGLKIPCRVVSVIDEPDRQGFAYGTLPGHPECGEELFVVERHADGSLEFVVTAFSRPASLLARAGGPATRWAQRTMTDRYLTALDRP